MWENMRVSSADPRLLGALRRTGGVGIGVCGWDETMDGTHLSFGFAPFQIALAESAHLFHDSVYFQLCFFFSSKRLYDIHVT